MGRRQKADPVRTCRHCATLLHRKAFNGRLEDRGVFLRRQFCDRICMAHGYVKAMPLHEDTFRWRARKLRGHCCESCGAMTRLHAHHIDGNEQNNWPENIQTLCVRCHISHHHRARRAGLTVAGKLVCLASPEA
jgi:5-methylcytosine-specific restriction endonuclease McrA